MGRLWSRGQGVQRSRFRSLDWRSCRCNQNAPHRNNCDVGWAAQPAEVGSADLDVDAIGQLERACCAALDELGEYRRIAKVGLE